MRSIRSSSSFKFWEGIQKHGCQDRELTPKIARSYVLGIIHRAGSYEKSQNTLKLWNRRARSCALPRVNITVSYWVFKFRPVLHPTRFALFLTRFKKRGKFGKQTDSPTKLLYFWGIGGYLIQIDWALHPIPIHQRIPNFH
jgi:hypothetical protein